MLSEFKSAFIVIGSVFICIFFFIGISLHNESKVSVVEDCTVMELQQQQLIQGSDGKINTEIRYLVITDKETFVCQSSLMNSKYNNSDIFWRLKKGQTYDFKVSGTGKSLLFNYRNILEVIN